MLLRKYISYLGDFYDGELVKGCPPACNTMDFRFGFPSKYPIKINSTAKLTIYFPTSVQVRESQLAYAKSSLFAEIGGYTGLLLGFSFFDCAKLFNFLAEQFQKRGKGLRSRSTYVKPK